MPESLIESLRQTVREAYASVEDSWSPSPGLRVQFVRRASGRPPYGLMGQPGPADEAWVSTADETLLLELFEALAAALGLKVARIQRTGARLDLHLLDSLGRAWPVGFIEPVDSQDDLDSSPLKDALLHASLLGPLTDVLALLLEHGRLPLWLATEQVRVLAVSERQLAYATDCVRRLHEAGLRVDPASQHLDGPLSGRVRRAELAQVPAILVVGEREAASGMISARDAAVETIGACVLRLQGEAATPFSYPRAVSGVAHSTPLTR